MWYRPRLVTAAGSDYPFEFACKRSGNCCAQPEGVVRVSEDEVARIAEYLGISEGGVWSRFVATGGDRLVEGLGGRCVFLVDGARAACQIYPARPKQCRTWPFWPELRKSPERLRAATRLCPGIVPLR